MAPGYVSPTTRAWLLSILLTNTVPPAHTRLKCRWKTLPATAPLRNIISSDKTLSHDPSSGRRQGAGIQRQRRQRKKDLAGRLQREARSTLFLSAGRHTHLYGTGLQSARQQRPAAGRGIFSPGHQP